MFYKGRLARLRAIIRWDLSCSISGKPLTVVGDNARMNAMSFSLIGHGIIASRLERSLKYLLFSSKVA